MAKPKYTVIIEHTGNFQVVKMEDVKDLKAKGTSLVKATKIARELNND
jgi:hypothetical protein